MKRLFLRPLFLLLAIASCKEKEYDCFAPIYYLRGCKIAFDGYSPKEVDSIRWFSYKAGTNFLEPPVDSQWVYTDSFTVKGAEIYKRTRIDSATSFVELKLGFDYRIVTPFKVHTVTNIKVGPPGFHYTRKDPCKSGETILPFDSLAVDSVMVRPAEKFHLQYYAWLKKP